FFFFFSSRRRHTRSKRDWSSDVCSSDLIGLGVERRSNLVKKLIERGGGSPASGGTDAAYRGRAAGGSVGRIFRIADIHCHGFQGQSHGFRGNDADHCARSSAQILRAERSGHRTVRLNG